MSHAQPMLSESATSESTSEMSELETALSDLAAKATEFARLPVAAKAGLVRECIPRLSECAHDWVTRGAKARGLPDLGEEWLTGPVPTMRMLRLLAESLEAIARTGKPPLGRKAHVRADGRVIIDAFPSSTIDGVLFSGFSGQIILEQGITLSEAKRKQASFYSQSSPEGGISLTLGAGNVSSIPAMDILSKMFIEGFVCILKMNPVNEWAGPPIEKALAPLISRGYLRVVYGGAKVGKFLVEHDSVADVHITGSDRTHDLIVWGPPGPERERRIRDNDPILKKPISSELGNVSPVAIVPYQYSDDELLFQAKNVASMVVNNGSFNCNAAKLLITSKDWEQREAFLGLVEKCLGEAPLRPAYYPGAFERYADLTEGRETTKIGTPKDGQLPWTLIRNVDSSDESDPIFKTEPFCAILSETTVGTADPIEFLTTVTRFMNERVWGTLNTMFIIHPKLEKDPAIARTLERSVTDLRYGTVGINVWPALCYGSVTLPWGGHQSATLENVQSGLGWVHNTFMVEGIDKAVIRGNIKAWPKPVWFYDHPRVTVMGPKLVEMDAAPSWLKVPALVYRAIV